MAFHRLCHGFPAGNNGVHRPRTHRQQDGVQNRKSRVRIPGLLCSKEFLNQVPEVSPASRIPCRKAFFDTPIFQYVEQIIRPTGLLDPIIEVRPIDGQVDDIIDEIHQRIEKNERVLITTLTKRMAEDLSAYLVELGLKVAYLHSDTKTLERTEILRDLRLGKYDVLVGINLLREGLDLPEVSLVCILDADKEGFLRSERSLIQTIGRAARNSHGKVIMYGDKITDSMQKAIDETARRREIQEKYNKEHGIIPQTIKKEIREAIHGQENVDEAISLVKKGKKAKKKDKETLIKELEKQMKEAAKALDFERAMELRDMMLELQGEV